MLVKDLLCLFIGVFLLAYVAHLSYRNVATYLLTFCVTMLLHMLLAEMIDTMPLAQIVKWIVVLTVFFIISLIGLKKWGKVWHQHIKEAK